MSPVTFDSKLQIQLGNLCFLNELYFKASQLFEWVKAKDQADVLTLYRLGIALRRIGEIDRAEQNLVECIKLRPEVAAVYLQMGHIYKARGDSEQAVDKYPGNFLHVGLIKRIMPRSIIIDCRRDPRDNAIMHEKVLEIRRKEPLCCSKSVQ